MAYVMSGIHGYCREYREMLEKIAVSNTDLLYIIGNVVDRGPDVIPLLEGIVARCNVCLLAGNHGYEMRCCYLHSLKQIKGHSVGMQKTGRKRPKTLRNAKAN